MSVAENVSASRRWFDELWNKKNTAIIYELMSPNGVAVGQDMPGVEIRGPRAFEEFFNRLHGAFPDMKLKLEDIFGVDDKVVIRWSATMTHTGDTLGMPATHRPVSVGGISIAQFENGKIIRGWDNWDQLAMMQQLSESAAASAG